MLIVKKYSKTPPPLLGIINEKDFSKDQAHGFGDIVQKITDEFVTKVDQMVEVKEKDLMKV